MYKKILIPLDGSELAECVLPHVEAISKSCSLGEAIFARVVEPFYLPTGIKGNTAVFQGTWEVIEKQKKDYEANAKTDAKKYLDAIGKRLNLGDLTPKSVLLAGKPADALVDYAAKNGVDLIILSTHGRSGISRWYWGSVAEKILRSACVPVMMVRAPGCGLED
jgi:nucleotide-binding universal stress UspA family protein